MQSRPVDSDEIESGLGEIILPKMANKTIPMLQTSEFSLFYSIVSFLRVALIAPEPLAPNRPELVVPIGPK